MADVSSSAAKEHVLKGSGEIQRVSGDAVSAARDAAHVYLQKLGALAAQAAAAEKRKTIMDTDIAAAVRALSAGSASAGDAPQA